MPGLRSLNPARAPAVQWLKPPTSRRPGGGGVGAIWEHRAPSTGPPGRGEHAGMQTCMARWSAHQTPGSWHHAALTRWTQLGPSRTCVFKSGFPFPWKTEGLSPWISRRFLVPALRCSSSMFWVMTTTCRPCLCSRAWHSAMARCPALGSVLCTTSRGSGRTPTPGTGSGRRPAGWPGPGGQAGGGGQGGKKG